MVISPTIQQIVRQIKEGRFVFFFLGFPALVKPHFEEVSINRTGFMFTWDYPDDTGGAEVTTFTVWFRAVGLVNNTQEEWSTVNVTQNGCSLRLNCCLTYEIMVTAWNRNGQSFTDPDNAARVTVLAGIIHISILGLFVEGGLS